MKNYFDETYNAVKGLINIDSVQGDAEPDAPFGKGPKKALEYSLALAEKMGFRVKNIENTVGWAEIGEGELFGILAHVDTVPLLDGWKADPLSADIVDGEIIGRGIVDDKGPFILSLYAVKSLLDEGKIPTKRIRFIIGTNEESGWACMDRYLLTEEIPALAISPDGDFPVINCEKGVAHLEMSVPCPESIIELVSGDRVNMVPDKAYCKLSCISDVAITYALHHGVKLKKDGDYWIAEAEGRSAHGSTPWLGDNALLKILNTIASLDETLNALACGFAKDDGSKCNIGLKDDVSGKLSMNVGYAKKQDDKLLIGLDIRFPISFTHQQIVDKLKEHFDFATFTMEGAHPALYFDENDPFVQTLLNAYKEVTGRNDARPLTIGGATYARALPRALAFGPCFPDEENMCHQVNERMSVKDFKDTFKIYRIALEKLCF